MRLLTVSMALGFILALEIPARAQTTETQDQVKDAVAKEKAARKAAQDALTKEKEKTAAKEKAATLEELLAQALRDNPDIRVAESKLREAEAELNRVRLLVTQKVVAQQRDIAFQKAALDSAETAYRRAQQLHSSGALSMEEFKNMQLTLEKLKAELARVEAELPYLLGASAIRRIVTSGHEWFLTKPMESRPVETHPLTHQKALEEPDEIRLRWLVESARKEERSSQSPLPAAMTDKIRKALDTPVHVDFKQAKPKEILDFLQQHTKGFNLVEQVRMDKAAPVDLHLTEPVPVGAVFQFLEDQYGWRFVVREYGIVVAEPGRVPPGAVDLQRFWKNRPPQATTTTSSVGSSSTSSSTSGQKK